MGVLRKLEVLHEPPSLSKSALLLSPCLAWADPQARYYDETLVEQKDHSKRDRGIRFHAIMDLMAEDQAHTPVHIPRELGDHVYHARRYLEELRDRSDVVRSELALGVNWSRSVSTILWDTKDRNYPNNQGWQYGTADLVCILKTGEVYVADWKTGGTDGAEEQLLSLAYAAQRSDEFSVYSSISGQMQTNLKRPVIISCLQVNEHGVWPKERSVSNEELDAHADAMRFQWEDIGKRNEPVPGVHCTTLYCPALAYCRAITEAVVVSATQAQEREVVEPMVLNGSYRLTDKPGTDAEAGYVISIAKAAKRQIDYWELAMKRYIKNGGRVTAGQYEWGPGGNGYRFRRNG